MMPARSVSRFIVGSMVCLLLIPAISLAKSSNPDLARMTASGSLVVWTTTASHEKISLTVVAPDGTIYRKEFASGMAPSLRLQDLGGKLSDGSYTYEMRFEPRISAAVKQQLAAAREAGDDAAATKIQRDNGINEAMVQSGSLAVVNGAFVSPDAEETPQSVLRLPAGGTSTASVNAPRTIKPLDVVTADDAIIQGSACIGLDCVNNESFGFDTIRLKENNTRIKFDDTSSSTGFPANDWQLTANDSASGGSNKFSIEDITGSKVPFTVTAGAATNSIFVDSTGRVGFRTSTPVLDLHVATSNTPALRLEQNNSGGFTAQTWDVAGNEANFFVRDVTGGSRLPFRIRPGAPTSSIDIAASGNVGIGTASPSAGLHVLTNLRIDGTDATGIRAIGFGGTSPTTNPNIYTNGSYLVVNAKNGANQLHLNFDSGATSLTTVQAGGGNVGIGCTSPTAKLVVASASGCSNPSSSLNPGDAQFTIASSRTFKENIEPIDVPDILKKIEAIPVVTYDFKDNGPKDRLGLIAEDFHAVFGRGDDKHINGQDVQMALWMAVQKLTAENKALTDRLSKLEATQQKTPN
ncbi:MAG: hypothetical protein QOK37_2092 [Thermoanaerobaculia bacterium]|jgi:hypothetical protein|nr:hypothetical protein [Thermoanaerobaculia bacterium]